MNRVSLASKTDNGVASDNISRSSSSSPTPDSRNNPEIAAGTFKLEPGIEGLSLQEDVGITPSRNLPSVAVPERIILCVDTSENPDHTLFKLEDGQTYPLFYMVKRVMEIFLHSKHTISEHHEFALVALRAKKGYWIRDFTSDPRIIIRDVEKLNTSSEPCILDLTALFDMIQVKISISTDANDSAVKLPPFVPRVVLIYSRSECIPQFLGGQDSFELLATNPYFTLDILYIHEEPSEENKCEEIYRRLMKLNQRGFSYVFSVQRNATKLHNNMAKLLAHPLQRPPQNEACYKLQLV